MASFFGGLGDFAKSVFCTLADKSGQLYNASPGSELDFFGNYRRFSNFVTRAFCNRPPTGDDPYGPDTCFPKRYRIDYTVNYKTRTLSGFTDQSSTSFVVVFGPIRKYEWTITGDNNYGPATLRVFHGDGLTAAGVASTQMFATGSPDDTYFKYTIDGVTDLDPGESCSVAPISPDPGYSPGDWTVIAPYTFQYNDGLDITIPVLLVFAKAEIDVNGTLSIPVNLDFTGNINLDPTFDFDVDINLPVNGDPPIIQPKYPKPSPPSPNPQPPSLPNPDDFEPFPTPPTEPGDLPDPTEPTPPEPTANVIRGCIVTTDFVASDAQISIIGQADNPDIYAPNLGYVAFRIRLSGGATAWSADIPVKNKRAIIECPWLGGAVDVRGTPRLGANFTVTPIWGKPVAEV